VNRQNLGQISLFFKTGVKKKIEKVETIVKVKSSVRLIFSSIALFLIAPVG
jgi:hypothetical protein